MSHYETKWLTTELHTACKIVLNFHRQINLRYKMLVVDVRRRRKVLYICDRGQFWADNN